MIIYHSYHYVDVFGQTNVGCFVSEQYDQINILETLNLLQGGRLHNADGTRPDEAVCFVDAWNYK